MKVFSSKISQRYLFNRHLAVVLVLFIMVSANMCNADTKEISENFSSSANWEIGTYYVQYHQLSGIYTVTQVTDRSVVNITNGVLQFTDLAPQYFQNFDNYFGKAHFNSSTDYGIWSFDFKADDLLTDLTFSFSYNYSNNTGYALEILTSDASGDIDAPYIALQWYYGTKFIFLESFFPSSNITGWNHIEIRRHIDDTIYVELNQQVILEYHNNTNTVAPKKGDTIAFTNYQGNTQVDNLVVIDKEISSDSFLFVKYSLYTGIFAAIVLTALNWTKAKKNF